MAGALDVSRQERPELLVLDGGDVFQGAWPVNATAGMGAVRAYELLGVDAAAVGNHEFDYGGMADGHPLRGAFEAAAAHLERMDRDAPDALLGVPIQHSVGGQTIQVMLDEAVVGFGEMPLSLVPADDFIVIAGTHEGHPALAIRMKMADARKLHAALQLIRVVRPAGPETVVAEGYDGALSLLPWSTRLPDPMSLVGQTVALVAMGGGTRRVSADRPMAWKRVAGITLLEMAPPLDDRIEDGAPTSDWIHLEVTLYGVPARILHRRFAMRAEATLADLAAALMELGGWEYAHLWEFTKGKNTLASMDDDLDAISLHEVLPRKRSRIGWLYDFGDYWQHSIRRVGHSDPEPGDTAYARLESAVGAFPPEDSGGVCGYEAMADAARAGRFRDDWHREFFPDWHPDRFDEDALRDRFDC